MYNKIITLPRASPMRFTKIIQEEIQRRTNERQGYFKKIKGKISRQEPEFKACIFLQLQKHCDHQSQMYC
jgi:hypothetical protein